MASSSLIPSLATLTPVPLREVFRNEAVHFTPWLAEHLDLLGDAIHVPLSRITAEHAIGAFSLDILAESDDGRLVAIENQIESTDHSHLGQLLVYAAGAGANVCVWVAARFREEHREAIDWLNHHTTEEIRMFAVEVSLVRIGDSPVAPRFDVVAAPNDWQRAIKASSTPSPSEWTRETFLGAFDDRDFRPVVEDLFQWTESLGGRIWFGRGAVGGAILHPIASEVGPLKLRTDGTWRGGWTTWKSKAGDPRWSPLIEMCAALSGDQTREHAPRMSMRLLLEPSVCQRVKDVALNVARSFADDPGTT